MKPTAKQEGYKFVKYIPGGAIFIELNNPLSPEVWCANKNHASYGFSWNNTDWEFARTATVRDVELILNPVSFTYTKPTPYTRVIRVNRIADTYKLLIDSYKPNNTRLYAVIRESKKITDYMPIAQLKAWMDEYSAGAEDEY